MFASPNFPCLGHEWFSSSCMFCVCSPVAALHSSPDRLFVGPGLLHPCSQICHVIEAADPGKFPCHHDVCRLASSVDFLHSHSVDHTRRAGQWSLSLSFIYTYWLTFVVDVPFLVIGIFPS